MAFAQGNPGAALRQAANEKPFRAALVQVLKGTDGDYRRLRRVAEKLVNHTRENKSANPVIGKCLRFYGRLTGNPTAFWLERHGAKLTSSNMVKLSDGRYRRVYVTCYSNIGSAWIMLDGKRLFLR